VPPGDLARADLDTITDGADRIVDLAGHVALAPGRRRTVDVRVELDDGRLLAGTVADVSGWDVATVGYSKVAPKHRLAAWARWLAVTASDPEERWRGITLGRHPWRKGRAHAMLLPPREEPPAARARWARELLARLVDLYDRGMCSPVPLYCETSAKSAEEVRKGNGARNFVDKAWETDPYAPFAREDLDPYHLLVLGRQVPTDELFVEPCPEDERWGDGHGGDGAGGHDRNDDSRFVAWARRLWDPILDAERSRSR
jgi:exodeoxyribonuclease V gamma subunit